MTRKRPSRRVAPDTEPPVVAPAKTAHVLLLFVAGATTRSRQAILRVRTLCESQPAGSCSLEVIDIYQLPGLAREHQIVATPTLIKAAPQPVQRYIGSFSDVTGLFVEAD